MERCDDKECPAYNEFEDSHCGEYAAIDECWDKTTFKESQAPLSSLSSDRLEGTNERIKELEAWIVDCRDKILYPLAHEDTEMGRLADGFGSSIVELLRKAD